MSSGPPPYPQGPQQPWTPYPTGPGYGMPPPPKKRGGLVAAVVGGVVLLVAAGVTTYIVVTGDSDGDGGPLGGSGGDGPQAVCEGEYCVGPYPYANACGVLDPVTTAARLGDVGDDGLLVQEHYADPLPPPGERPQTWTYGLRSNCHASPRDRDGATVTGLTLELQQFGNGKPTPPEKGRPLPGVEGALVEDEDGAAAVTWIKGHILARLDVVWGNRNSDIPDGKIAEALTAVDSALAAPPSEVSDLGDLTSGGRPVVVDACEVFTGADFEAATKYAVNPTNIKRTYQSGSGATETSCMRFTAPKNSDFPAAQGSTFLDGAMNPTVRVSKLPDAAAAKARFAEERERLIAPAALPGVGDGAVYGIRDSSAFTVRFTKGFHYVTVDCGLSNGNSDWTPADMRKRLEPLAEAIANRMP